MNAIAHNAHYFAHSCGLRYTRDEPHWTAFFGEIADRIVRDIGPATVLDAGCAVGFLVEALRDRGVEAYGIDVSEYALAQVPPAIGDAFRRASVTDPFPRDYDLIVCIEVLEHLPARAAEAAVANICAHTRDVIFSSTPSDFDEATHVNVQPPEYWAELFGRHGFFRDVEYDGSFITPWAARYCKVDEPVARALARYERRLWQLLRENQSVRQKLIEQRDELSRRERELASAHPAATPDAQLARALAEAQAELDRLRRTRTFRYTAGARALYGGLRRLRRRSAKRVLVFSGDHVPISGLPTTGSGLRAWGLGQGLQSRGHDVVFSLPRVSLARYAGVVSADVVAHSWDDFAMSDVVGAVQPDVVVLCGWALSPHLGTCCAGRIPVVLDQHGPHMLERDYQGFGESDSNAAVKTAALAACDYFSCAGERQRPYFESWLERAGWTERERRERAAAVRVSLAPELPARAPEAEPSFVFGGVFLPWQDPTRALTTLVDELERRGRGRLRIFGGKHPWLPIPTGVYDDLLERLEASEHADVAGHVAHAELIGAYTRSHVAIDLMERNAERELAFTTRTVEYLWCGLPVIYNDYSELSELIREYDAGWTLDPADSDGLRAAISEILDDERRVAEKSANAQRLVRERLTWDRTIAPIDGFVRTAALRPRDSRVTAVA